MFKVGQEVWIKDLKEYGTLVEIDIERNEYHSKLNAGIDYSRLDNLHQTAHDMFVELGFALINQSIKGANYLQTNDCEIYPYNKDDKIQIVFYKEVEGYVVRSPLSDINGDIVIKLELHQAIHQMMNELGWL